MRRSRQVLAVVIVATALCAERGVAAPVARPQVSSVATGPSLAGRILDRLSSGLKGAVAVRLSRPPARPEPARASVIARLPDQSHDRDHRPSSPLLFRLPPPAVV